MTKTTVKAHPRKGTKGVKKHSRSKSGGKTVPYDTKSKKKQKQRRFQKVPFTHIENTVRASAQYDSRKGITNIAVVDTDPDKVTTVTIVAPAKVESIQVRELGNLLAVEGKGRRDMGTVIEEIPVSGKEK